jgi:tRNA pseudouridine13 synthase
MKLKQQPDDFRVEELTDIAPTDAGRFALYRLEKRGWTTPDALQIVRRRWKIAPRRVSFGGLKDRHAHTIQYFTILRGPWRRLTHQQIHVEYLGPVEQPYTSQNIRANRFDLTIRDLHPADVALAEESLAEVREQGVPSYFDDQRFGSASDPAKFMAPALVQGDYERALRLALVEPYEHDRAAAKKEKAILRNHWGNWVRCQTHLPPGQARQVVDYLVEHPDDYQGAIGQLRPELRGLYLSAYQSFLWNRMLARWLRQHVSSEQLQPVRLHLGELPMHRKLDIETWEKLRGLLLPLPHARWPFEPGDPRAELMDAVLREDGLERAQLQLQNLRGLFFSKGERPALCMPAELSAVSGNDEINSGKRKLALHFELPRGAYATLVVKRALGNGQ